MNLFINNFSPPSPEGENCMFCIKLWGSSSKDVKNLQFFQGITVPEYASVVLVYY